MGKVPKDTISTEARILEAAHKVFLVKGYSAATVRDVAKESKTNVASVNYYFRSKEKLFNEVMMRAIQQLSGAMIPIVIDEKTTLNQKIDKIVDSYLDILTDNPDLPVFIVSEFGKRNVEVVSKVQLGKSVLNQSSFMKQLKKAGGEVDPRHFFFCVVGTIWFPFVTKSIFIQSGLVDEKAFQKMMKERKKLIPIWMKAILKLK